MDMDKGLQAICWGAAGGGECWILGLKSLLLKKKVKWL